MKLKRLRTRASLDDDKHAELLNETGFWGSAGAGCLVLCTSTRRLLLGLRSKDVFEPLTWGTFGGAIDSTEDPKRAAIRELREETGYKGSVQLAPLLTYRKGDFRFFNYLALVPAEFKPKLDWENSRADWFAFKDLPAPRHFGLTAIFQDSRSLAMLTRYFR